MDRNSLSTNQELRRGDYLMSENNQYKAIFQDDGNFVIYKWAPVWASNTEGTDAFRVLLQEDQNLVIYNNTHQALWNSGIYTKCPSQQVRLTLTNEGHLVVDNKGVKVWKSERK